ncbi:MAG TPA: hypothetical protein VD768_08580, partial [Sphingomicrobium sp.]|nr:hypothetical protein [Sphingomicrobium sp.]
MTKTYWLATAGAAALLSAQSAVASAQEAVAAVAAPLAADAQPTDAAEIVVLGRIGYRNRTEAAEP